MGNKKGREAMTPETIAHLRALADADYEYKEDAFEAGQEALQALPELLDELEGLDIVTSDLSRVMQTNERLRGERDHYKDVAEDAIKGQNLVQAELERTKRALDVATWELSNVCGFGQSRNGRACRGLDTIERILAGGDE